MNHLPSSNLPRLYGAVTGHHRVDAALASRLYFPVKILLSREALRESQPRDGQRSCSLEVSLRGCWDMNTESERSLCLSTISPSRYAKSCCLLLLLSLCFSVGVPLRAEQSYSLLRSLHATTFSSFLSQSSLQKPLQLLASTSKKLLLHCYIVHVSTLNP